MPTRDRNALREAAAIEQAKRDMHWLRQLLNQGKVAGRHIEGQSGMAWRLWNPALPSTTLDLHLTRGTIVQRGRARTDGKGVLFAMQILGIALDK